MSTDGYARCLGCYYVIEGLPEPRCPECGRPFDLNDPESYTRKPVFVAWRFWMPGLLLSVGVGLILYLAMFAYVGVGPALTIVIPAAMGMILGYGCRVPLLWRFGLGIIALITTALILVTGKIEGLLCGVMLGVLALVPTFFGVLLGWWLRGTLKRTQFSQRAHLPIILAAMLVPAAWGAAERWRATHHPTPRPIVVVVTSEIFDTDVRSAWDGVMFYEDVRHAPPLILRLGPRPLYTRGSSQHVGDTKTCVYDSGGRLTKKITQRRPGELLSFDVVEQRNIENCTTRLIDGSFAFECIDPRHTRVTLTTRYEALITPRWYWEPAERYVAHALHRQVLSGMRMEAERRTRAESVTLNGPHMPAE